MTEVSVFKLKSSAKEDEFKKELEKRKGQDYASYYFEFYEREKDLTEELRKREPRDARIFAQEIVKRGLKESDYKKAQRMKKVDELILDNFNSMYEIKEDTKLVDTVGLIKLSSFNGFKFILDSIMNSNTENPLVAVMIPCYEDDDDENENQAEMDEVITVPKGFEYQDKVVIWDSDKSSSTKLYKFEGDTSLKVSGINRIGNLEYVLLILFELQPSKDGPKLRQYGFTVIPNKTLSYFLHGCFQLPIYKERLREEDMKYISKQTFWEVVLSANRQARNSDLQILESTCIVRIVPFELDDIYLEADDFLLINTMFLPDDFKRTKLLTEKNLNKAKESKPSVGDIFPEEFPPGQEIVTKVEEYIKKRLASESHQSVAGGSIKEASKLGSQKSREQSRKPSESVESPKNA